MFDMNNNGFFELITRLSQKLLLYAPLQDIYDVNRHNFPLKQIESFSDFGLIDWMKIKENYFKVLNGLYFYIGNDDYINKTENNINDDIFDLFTDFKLISITKFNDEQKELFIKTTLLLNLYACCVEPIGNSSHLLDSGTFDTKKQGFFYRGESKFSFNLIPSIFRTININGLKLFKEEEILNFYKARKLIQKYNSFENYSSLNYEFCALMQHAGCKSPFLDLTLDSKVALSFASSENQNEDGSIYVFNNMIPAIDKNDEIKDIFVVVSNKKFDLHTILGSDSILLCDIDKFDVDAVIYTKKTNDRMKMQKGLSYS